MCMYAGPSTRAWATHQGHLVTSASMLPLRGATLAGPTGQDLAISVWGEEGGTIQPSSKENVNSREVIEEEGNKLS